MANRSYLYDLLTPDGMQIHSILLLVCGTSLLLAIPFAGRVSQITDSAIGDLHLPSAFFVLYTLFMALVGLNRGTLAAHRRDMAYGKALVVGQVLVAQALVVPFLVFVRAIFPGAAGRIALVASYVTLTTLASGLIGLAIESRALRTGKSSFPLRHLVILAYFVVPVFLGFADHAAARYVSVLSPLSTVLQLLTGLPVAVGVVAFLLPIAIVIPLFASGRRGPQGDGR